MHPVKLVCKKCQKTLFKQLCSPYNEEEIDGDAFPSSTPNMPHDKKMIHHYQVEKKIGEGGMGKIFLVTNTKTKKKEVLKLLKLENLENQENLLPYFIREAQILEKLDHPYIVKFSGYGKIKDTPYLVMEFIEGKTLETVLKEEKKIKLSWTIPIISRLANALEYTESFNIIHRDLNPSNIILMNENPKIPKIIDFGLAKSLVGHSQITRSGIMMGKIFYMPKEQIEDSKKADFRSDIYALGATCYEMISGQPPFYEFLTQGKFAIMDAILSGKLTPLRKLRPNLPSILYKIVEKAMALEPKNRYQVASEIRADIKELLLSISRQ